MKTWQQLRDDPAARARVDMKWRKFQGIRTLFEPSFLYRQLFENVETRQRLRVIDIPKKAGRPERYRMRHVELDIVTVEIEPDDYLELPSSARFHIMRMLKKKGIEPELADEWPIFQFDRYETGGTIFIQIRERLKNGTRLKRTLDRAHDTGPPEA